MTYESARAAWLTAAQAIPDLPHNTTANEPEIDGSDHAAEKRGDHMSEWDQDRLAERRAG